MPDGDADIDDVDFSTMKIPDCKYCGGILKPNVVFFGDSIPKPRLIDVSHQMELADGILVLVHHKCGTSWSVLPGPASR